MNNLYKYFAGALWGMFIIWVIWMGTHDCYAFHENTAMLCRSHGFNLDWMIPH